MGSLIEELKELGGPECCGDFVQHAVCCGNCLPSGECCGQPVGGEPECCQNPIPDVHYRAIDRIEELEECIRALLSTGQKLRRHIDLIVFRDSAHMRLDDRTPQYEHFCNVLDRVHQVMPPTITNTPNNKGEE